MLWWATASGAVLGCAGCGFSGEADVELSLVVPRAPQHDYTAIDA